mgnify:CR=1 FL=1
MPPLKDSVYDVLKWITLVVIPACTTFYTVVAPLFGWYDPAVIAKVSAAVCTLIGAIIGISTAQYNAKK